VGIILVVVGFMGPWWTITFSGSLMGQTMTGQADYQLFGGTAKFQGPGMSMTNTTDYSSEPNTRAVFQTASALSAVAIVLGILMIVLVLMASKNPSMGRLGAILGILAFLLALVAVLYVMSQLPGAVNADATPQGTMSFGEITGFWGSRSVNIMGVSVSAVWAAGWAWYVVLVGAIVFLIGGILAFLPPKPAPAPPMAAPSQMTPPSPPAP